MAVLVEAPIAQKPSKNEGLAECELPLQRIYACERTRANELFLTQPLQGEALEWTWDSAMDEVRRIAAWLESQHWPPGSRIVIFSKNCAWWIMADFAIWMAGHVSVPFFPAARGGALVELFLHSKPVACFVGQMDRPLPLGERAFKKLAYIAFPNCETEHLPPGSTRWQDVVQNQAPLKACPSREAGEPATIIYTSGTTGQPKGVVRSFQAMSLMGKSIEAGFQRSEKDADRILSYLPLAHVAERAIVEMSSLFMPIHIFFSESQEKFLIDLKRSRSTLFFSVPRLFVRFQQGVFEKIPEKKLNRLLAIPILGWLVRKKILRRLGLNHTRIVAGGGAATPVEIINWYRKLGVNFVEGYGMTETGITHVPLPGQYRVGFVGNAAGCAETRISASGEVQIKGPMNMLGYFRNPELTQEAFTEDGYFHTGDRGEIDEQGRMRLIGRLKEEFKTSKGKYVAPASIEKLFSLSTLFEATAIFGAGMAAPFAMAVLVPERRQMCRTQEQRAALEPELLSLLDRVNAQLEHHEQISFIVLCQEPWTPENGLLTPTMKVRRASIEQHFAPRFKDWETNEGRVIWFDALVRGAQ